MGQVVDTQSAAEFMREVSQRISLAELDALEQEVGEKSELFQRALAPEAIQSVSSEDLKRVLRRIFSIRRRLAVIHTQHPHDELKSLIAELLYGQSDLPVRFQYFCEQVKELDETLASDFASELLHYTRPDKYWLWTRWMWDPQTDTGALRLVTTDEINLQGKSLAEIYMKVGEAVAIVNATSEAAGLIRMGEQRFGLDVFLACVYGIYTYTVLRMRMTQEFNNVMPKLPELASRLLGVWKKDKAQLASTSAA